MCGEHYSATRVRRDSDILTTMNTGTHSQRGELLIALRRSDAGITEWSSIVPQLPSCWDALDDIGDLGELLPDHFRAATLTIDIGADVTYIPAAGASYGCAGEPETWDEDRFLIGADLVVDGHTIAIDDDLSMQLFDRFKTHIDDVELSPE